MGKAFQVFPLLLPSHAQVFIIFIFVCTSRFSLIENASKFIEPSVNKQPQAMLIICRIEHKIDFNFIRFSIQYHFICFYKRTFHDHFTNCSFQLRLVQNESQLIQKLVSNEKFPFKR